MLKIGFGLFLLILLLIIFNHLFKWDSGSLFFAAIFSFAFFFYYFRNEIYQFHNLNLMEFLDKKEFALKDNLRDANEWIFRNKELFKEKGFEINKKEFNFNPKLLRLSVENVSFLTMYYYEIKSDNEVYYFDPNSFYWDTRESKLRKLSLIYFNTISYVKFKKTKTNIGMASLEQTILKKDPPKKLSVQFFDKFNT